jgi:hypothetical protein
MSYIKEEFIDKIQHDVVEEFKDKIQHDVVGRSGDSEFDAKVLLFSWLNSSPRNKASGPYSGAGWPSFCNKPIEDWDEVFRTYFTDNGLRAAKLIYDTFVKKNLVDWLNNLNPHYRGSSEPAGDGDKIDYYSSNPDNDNLFGPSRGWPSFCNKPIEAWDDGRFHHVKKLHAAKVAYIKYRNLTGGKRRKRTKFNKRKSSSRVLSKSRRRIHRK